MTVPQLGARGYGRLWPVRAGVERLIARLRPVLHAPVHGPAVTVVSPHLDDAVFSCGQLIAGSRDATVITVFSADAPDRTALTAWDRSCGFRAGDDVMAVRAAEDDAALAALGARGVRLGLAESSYAGAVDEAAVERALTAAILARPDTTIVVPMGLHHRDHVTVADIASRVCRGHPELEWWLYADLPYGARFPQAVESRLAALGGPHPVQPPVATIDRKRAAIRLYRSQLRVLRRDVPLMLVEERYWRAEPQGSVSSLTMIGTSGSARSPR